MTINSFHHSQFHASVTIIPAYVETNQCTCRDVISPALRHAPVATQKGVADLWFITFTINARANACAYW